MKSVPVSGGESGFISQHNGVRSDAFGASQLLAHQQLGTLALPTNPSNGQTVTLTINGSAITFTGKTGTLSSAGDFKIGGSAAVTDLNFITGLLNPGTTTSTFIAVSAANQQLLSYCGYSLSGTSIAMFSFNNAIAAPLTSFTASTTATGGSWTANTMALYVQPGSYYIGTTLVKYAGGKTSTFTAPTTNPRIDIVTLDNAGTLAVTTGTESASPTAPAYPANQLVVCEVFHRVGETIIRDWDDGTQGYISNDSRPVLAPPYVSSSSQVAPQIFIPWITSPAQGDIMYFNGSTWVRLAAGTSGFFLETLGAGANPTWAQAAGFPSFVYALFTADSTVFSPPMDLVFDTDAVDGLSEYNNSNGKFTAASPGTYLVNVQGTFIAAVTNQTIGFSIYKNGTLYHEGPRMSAANTTNAFPAGLTASITLVASDFITIRYVSSNSTNTTIKAQSSVTITRIR